MNKIIKKNILQKGKKFFLICLNKLSRNYIICKDLGWISMISQNSRDKKRERKNTHTHKTRLYIKYGSFPTVHWFETLLLMWRCQTAPCCSHSPHSLVECWLSWTTFSPWPEKPYRGKSKQLGPGRCWKLRPWWTPPSGSTTLDLLCSFPTEK